VGFCNSGPALHQLPEFPGSIPDMGANKDRRIPNLLQMIDKLSVLLKKNTFNACF